MHWTLERPPSVPTLERRYEDMQYFFIITKFIKHTYITEGTWTAT